MKKHVFYLFFLILILGCAHPAVAPNRYIELTYKDFGPPSLAEALLGSDYWQWDNHGDSRPREYPIGVIVYRHIDLNAIEQKFPVVEEKSRDYRYVEYEQAITFLNDALKDLEAHADEIPPEMIRTLKGTRGKIESQFNRR